MKHITENEFIFTTFFNPTNKNAKRGEECEHQELVSTVCFFMSEYGESKFSRISLSKSQILMMAEKIKEIESNKQVLIYESMPF